MPIRLPLLLLMLSVWPARAEPVPEPPAPVFEQLPALGLVGHGRFEFLWMDIYTAALWMPGGEYAPDVPLALAIRYDRELDGEAIARRSIDEMRALGVDDESVLADWDRQMKAIFPDVRTGDQLTGVHATDGRTLFYLNGEFLAAVEDLRFGPLFFGIWLHENSRAAELRRALLNQEAL